MATTLRAYSIMVLAVFGVVVNLACIGILLRRRRNAIFHNLLKVCYCSGDVKSKIAKTSSRHIGLSHYPMAQPQNV